MSENTLDEYVDVVDLVIKASIPSKTEDAELHDLVEKYQIHKHSRSCRKYKNSDCRYGFGHYFNDKTIIAKPLPEHISTETKSSILSKRNTCLTKVKMFLT